MNESALSCPIPQPPGDRVLLAHGEGARLSRRLIRDLVVAAFENPYLRSMADGASLPPIDGPIAMTTDSYVVSPLIFPGGDIGRLAVYGTINDLAACGAEPLYLSLGLIIEEGLSLDLLRSLIGSIADAARECGVLIVTGDTKVVPRGVADGLFVNTTGLGRLRPGMSLGPERIRPGDRVLISGTIGDHGLAILSAREGLMLESELRSDTAPLHGLVADLLACKADVRWLRDPTRGGVSASLHEAAETSGLSIVLDEAALPLSEATRGICELFGLDPLYVANEGKMLAIVSSEDAEAALASLRRHPSGTAAAVIGEITHEARPQVLVRGLMGALRVLDEPGGAPLPRIC